MPAHVPTSNIRSVERALLLIELIGQHGALGLEDIHLLTELPKATVSRLLSTLVEQEWVRRGICDWRYRLCSKRLVGCSEQRFNRNLVEAATPLLKAVSEETGLVADLSIFNGEDLVVAESCIPNKLQARYPRKLMLAGQQASIFYSAMGKACLYELSAAGVQRLSDRHNLRAEQLLEASEKTASLGFGVRTECSWEFSVKLPFYIRAVALPIHYGDKTIGSIALHWPQDVLAVEDVERLFLPVLSGAICVLEKNLSCQQN